MKRGILFFFFLLFLLPFSFLSLPSTVRADDGAAGSQCSGTAIDDPQGSCNADLVCDYTHATCDSNGNNCTGGTCVAKQPVGSSCNIVSIRNAQGTCADNLTCELSHAQCDKIGFCTGGTCTALQTIGEKCLLSLATIDQNNPQTYQGTCDTGLACTFNMLDCLKSVNQNKSSAGTCLGTCKDANIDPPIPPSPPCGQWGSQGTCAMFNSGLGSIYTDPSDFIKTIFGILLSVSGGIALLLIIKSGYQLMTAQGKPEQLQQGRDQLIAAIVGLIFLIFSFVFLQIIGFNILQVPGFGSASTSNPPRVCNPTQCYDKAACQRTQGNCTTNGCPPGLAC